MLYAIAYVLVWLFAKIFFRLKVIGVENIPRRGGVIVAANHNSYLDIPLLGCSLRRRADNIAKAELFEVGAVSWLFRTLGGIPVRRGTIDREALNEAVARLRSGHLLALYPEGRRSRDTQLLTAKPGIGLLVARTGVPVIPAYIEGTHRACPPGSRWIRPARVKITFGKPVDLRRFLSEVPAGGREPKAEGKAEGRKQVYQDIAEEIMRQIGALRPAEARVSGL